MGMIACEYMKASGSAHSDAHGMHARPMCAVWRAVQHQLSAVLAVGGRILLADRYAYPMRARLGGTGEQVMGALSGISVASGSGLSAPVRHLSAARARAQRPAEPWQGSFASRCAKPQTICVM